MRLACASQTRPPILRCQPRKAARRRLSSVMPCALWIVIAHAATLRLLRVVTTTAAAWPA